MRCTGKTGAIWMKPDRVDNPRMILKRMNLDFPFRIPNLDQFIICPAGHQPHVRTELRSPNPIVVPRETELELAVTHTPSFD